MSVGIQASVNKFAFLHVQDSSEESDSAAQVTAGKVKNPSSSKTKSATGNAANAKKKQRRRKKKNNSTSSNVPVPSAIGQKQLQDWVEHDRNFVDHLHEEDIRRAIEISKVEYEKLESETYHAQSANINTQHNDEVDSSDLLAGTSPPKKERKKLKPAKTISLEEFHQHVENSLPLKKDEPMPVKEERVPQVKSTYIKTDFFEEVDKAASYAKRNETAMQRFRTEHEHKKNKSTKVHYEVINKRDQHNQAEAEKDELIDKLSKELTEQKKQYKHVKKRNNQLLAMLQQGEMKDKSELLLEIERLGILRDELTQEVSNLNESLEQERSRSRRLKDEVAKLQKKANNEDMANSK